MYFIPFKKKGYLSLESYPQGYIVPFSVSLLSLICTVYLTWQCESVSMKQPLNHLNYIVRTFGLQFMPYMF